METEKGVINIKELEDSINNVNDSIVQMVNMFKETQNLNENGLLTVKTLTEKSKQTSNAQLEVDTTVREMEKSTTTNYTL